MKKVISIFIITHCLLQISTAQWIQQSSFTTNNLYDVEFYNRYTGWAVGDGGKILKTTNGGINWLSIPNPAVGKPLSSIHLVDSNICYVVGWFETIIKSTNAGASWIVIRNGAFGSGSSYDAVFFINENTGWIAGTGQKILRTTNGGDSIITTPLFAGNLHDMYFKDNSSGIVVGSGTDVFKTSNGGVNWYNIVIPIGFVIPTFYKISFVNNKFGWLAGSDNRIFKTTDFGNSWDSLSRTPVNKLTASMRFAEFIDENTGFVGGERGYLFKSTDGGQNFVRENTGNFEPAFISSMYLYSDSIGWISGGAGKIMNTTNGGQILVGVANVYSTIENKNILYQNYPNPFNPRTIISYGLNKKNYVELKIFDLSGREIVSLVNNFKEQGTYSLEFNSEKLNLSSGMYYYSLIIDHMIIDTKRMILLK